MSHLNYLGLEIEVESLYKWKDLVELLNKGGDTDDTLYGLFSKYLDMYDNTLVWRVPISTDQLCGCAIVPVQEGFLRIPYLEVNAEREYGLYATSDAELLNLESFDALYSDYVSYADGLQLALDEIRKLLESQAYSLWIRNDSGWHEYQKKLDEKKALEFKDFVLKFTSCDALVLQSCAEQPQAHVLDAIWLEQKG